MDAKTLEALNASIEKWERNAVAETPDNYHIGVLDCPLCSLFYGDDCDDCPVMQSSGQLRCRLTPYDAAVTAKKQWSMGDGTGKAAHEAARAEVAFLKSLRPSSPTS